jgi:membrane protein
MQEGELKLVAASLSFSTILALIPFIAVVLATLKIVGGGFELFYPKVEHIFLANLRETAGVEAARTIKGFLRNINAGKMGTTGAIFLVLASLRLIHDMEVGINRIWNHKKSSRRIYKRLFFYWVLILLIPFALAIYVSMASLAEVEAYRRIVPAMITSLLFLIGGLYMVYKWVPDLKVHWIAALTSATLTSIVLYSAQKVLTWVTLQLFNYNKIYGSFAAFPILLLWVLMVWYIILGGVAVSVSLYRQCDSEYEGQKTH